MKKYHLLLAGLLLVLLVVSATGLISVYLPKPTVLTPKQKPEVANFEECIAAGYPVMESYPRRCRANGTVFVEDTSQDKPDLIVIDYPQPNQKITSPLEITGRARGTWFFEASFPVILVDSEGNELARVAAQAQGEWMTEDFVAFTATLIFDTPISNAGELILQKDNPSGLPENADELRIPVSF